MKRSRFGIAFWLAGLVAAGAAEENFSRALRAEDFAAAGLGKLTPAEIARLDSLVRDFKSGALERARGEAAAAEARAAQAEAKAKAATAAAAAAAASATRAEPERKAESSLLARAKVLLTPGTQIEYATIESRIVGDFRGWEGRTVFTLENGQRWRATGSGTYVTPPIAGPAVKIAPGVLGTFWMSVEGVKQRVKVEILGGVK